MAPQNYHPDSQTGLELALLCDERCEPLDILELATLTESPTIKLDSLEERERTLDLVLLVLLGRLLEAVFEYCFCLMCSLSNESRDKLLVGLIASSLCSIFWEKKENVNKILLKFV